MFTVANADLDSLCVCDAQSPLQCVAYDNVSRSFIYYSYSRFSNET